CTVTEIRACRVKSGGPRFRWSTRADCRLGALRLCAVCTASNAETRNMRATQDATKRAGSVGRCRQVLCGLTALLTAAALLVAAPASSGASGAGVPNLSGSEISVRLVASGLGALTTIVWRHNDARMYVAVKTGSVRIVNPDGSVVPTPVVTESVLSQGEQ